MSKRNKRSKKNDETLVDIVEVKDQAQDWFEENQTLIVGALAAVVLIVGGYLAYMNFVQKPKIMEAQEQITQAQAQFEKDSFALALSNPGGGYDGFLGIIENYGGTPSANLAKYYAGMSYLYLGDYQQAIDFLEDYNADGLNLPTMKLGAIGDAHSELGNVEEAKSYYKKAAELNDNEFLSAYYLKKYGEYLEANGDGAGALAAYEQLKADYPASPDARNIDLYIARLK